MELAPPGTVDPSPFLYDSTFYGMAGIISVAAVANSMITKVDRVPAPVRKAAGWYVLLRAERRRSRGFL